MKYKSKLSQTRAFAIASKTLGARSLGEETSPGREWGLHQTMRRLSSNGDKPSNGGKLHLIFDLEQKNY